MRIRGRLRRDRAEGTPAPVEGDYVEIDANELTGVFAAPGWLRDIGFTSWLLVGFALVLVAAIWLATLMQTIVAPVITAAVVAAVAAPVVGWLHGHRIPRPIGAIMVLLGLMGIGVGLFLMVVGGITSEAGDIAGQLDDARATMQGWLEDVGIDPQTAANANKDAAASISASFSQFLDGVKSGISALSGLAFFLALTILSLFFLLSDGPKIREWAEGHLGVPRPAAHAMGQRVLGALRGYFLGVTLIAAFNAAVVTLGALVLGVPLIGTIAAVTFVGAYIPYLGAWTAAGFSVLLALGGAGPEAAGGMVVVQLLANGILQQMVQPFAMGAALGIHPLAVLIVTIAGGALFGPVGLILAAPLTSAAVRISKDLERARENDALPEPNPSTQEERSDERNP
jgi:predicted PurR-regulated permease PerM